MDRNDKQFLKDIENERILKGLHVNADILENQKKIKNAYELNLLRGIDNKNK